MTKPRNPPRRRAPDDDALAWELAAAAHTYMSRIDADRIYIAIGIGDTFEAIDALITTIVRGDIPLGRDLVATVADWLDCYRGQGAERRLRQLLGEVKYVAPQARSAFEQRFGLSGQDAGTDHRRFG